MNQRLKITYNDEKTLDVIVTDKECSDFLKTINEGKIFWDPDKKRGFWTGMSNVRFIQIETVDDNAPSPANILSEDNSEETIT